MAKDWVLERLYELAEGQDGYFTMRQAKAAGVRPEAVVMAAKRGRLERFSRGVYRFKRFPPSSRGQLWEAVLWPQAYNEVPAALSHETALAVRDLSDVNPAKVHITVPLKVRLRRAVPKWLQVHRAPMEEREIEILEGLPVMGIQRTLEDVRAAGNLVAYDSALHALGITVFQG